MPDGTKNLVPFQSTEEAREKGRKGGIASGESRRRKRALKDAIDLFLSLEVRDQSTWNAISELGVDPKEINNQMAIIVGLTKAAMQGDSKAANILFDRLGEKPDESDDTGVTIVDDL